MRLPWTLRDVGRVLQCCGEMTARDAVVDLGEAWLAGGSEGAERVRRSLRAVGTRARERLSAEDLAGILADRIRRERSGRVCDWAEVERALWLVLREVECLKV